MQLKIEEKCQQNWANMRDTDSQQKFCDLCAKSVHDLDNYSFKELKTFLNENPTACVKIKTRNLDQFNSYEASKSISNQSKKWIKLSSLAGFLSFSTLAKAQAENDSIVVQGIINDNNGFPIADAVINLKNSDKIVYTDENGKFELKVLKQDSPYEIEYDYVGIEKQVFLVNNPAVCQVITDKQEINYLELGGPIIYRKRTFVGKTLRKVTWPFRQIGKLFREE